MTLLIDGSDYSSLRFAIQGEKLIEKIYVVDPHKSFETLLKLDEFLKKQKINLKDIKKVVVNKGPGSFTGVRVSVSHALALGLALGIPVRAISKTAFDKLF